MKKGYLIPILAVMFACSFFFVASFSNGSNPTQINNLGASVNYGAMDCVWTTGDFEGRESKASVGIIELVGCPHNVLYDTGEEAIEQYLGAGAGAGDAFDWIELCNATVGATTGCGEPQADKSEEYTAIASCGLENVAGTYNSLGNGNWTISHTFTSTCDNVITNVTRLRNDDDDDLAGNSFTLVTLQTDDQLLINKTIWVA